LVGSRDARDARTNVPADIENVEAGFNTLRTSARDRLWPSYPSVKIRGDATVVGH
jgi:hypothetical protein